MKRSAWPIFSITQALQPPDGWRTDRAILATYSAELPVVVTALLALSGCDLETRRTGSQIELIRALDNLRGRVRVLAQKNRIALPRASSKVSILKLLDEFVMAVDADETTFSWHPKIALVRYVRGDDSSDFQWRIWIGSRNLTASSNWDAGVTFSSRREGGKVITGVGGMAEELATRARLSKFGAAVIRSELDTLRWDYPGGCDHASIHWLGSGAESLAPWSTGELDDIVVVSPFLDATTVRALGSAGGARAKRTLVSTISALQSLHQNDSNVFAGFHGVYVSGEPILTAEGVGLLSEDDSAANETDDAEHLPPAGLHAKLILTVRGSQRKLWIGSANATDRAWNGRNFEAVVRLDVPLDVVRAIEQFVLDSERFSAGAPFPPQDPEEVLLYSVRQSLSKSWAPTQRELNGELRLSSDTAPAAAESQITMEVASLGGAWVRWPAGATSVTLLPDPLSPSRSDFIQVRLICGTKTCGWIQIAACEPRPDPQRNRALVAQYLDAASFVEWLRSYLTDGPTDEGGGDWDGGDFERPEYRPPQQLDPGSILSIEEILRGWTRDPQMFKEVDAKIRDYVGEIVKAANQRNDSQSAAALSTFEETWNTVAEELR